MLFDLLFQTWPACLYWVRRPNSHCFLRYHLYHASSSRSFSWPPVSLYGHSSSRYQTRASVWCVRRLVSLDLQWVLELKTVSSRWSPFGRPFLSRALTQDYLSTVRVCRLSPCAPLRMILLLSGILLFACSQALLHREEPKAARCLLAATDSFLLVAWYLPYAIASILCWCAHVIR